MSSPECTPFAMVVSPRVPGFLAIWRLVKFNGTILVGRCATHFRTYFSGWIGMFTER